MFEDAEQKKIRCMKEDKLVDKSQCSGCSAYLSDQDWLNIYDRCSYKRDFILATQKLYKQQGY
nr:hypothetical protein 2 [bacterium]